MRKIRLTKFTPSEKYSTDEKIKNLERYIVILQRELEYVMNTANFGRNEG